MTAVEEPLSQGAAATPAGQGSRPLALPALCPYLATPDGTWRSSSAVREHRCTAVAPPVPLALEKQRRLCLVADHTTCATYQAAHVARDAPYAGSHARPTHVSRPIARMTPVILDQRRFDIRLPVFRADRAPGQAILVGLLGLAFVALLVARPSSNGGVNPAGFDASASPGQSTSAATDGAVASPPASAPQLTPSPETTEVPIDSVSPSSPTPSSPRPIASPSSEPSTQPATSGATYKVKSGDTLSAIASRFGTTTRVLIRLNGITDPSRLKVGQILKLP